MIEDIALYISSNQWVVLLPVTIGAAIAGAGVLTSTERDNGSYIFPVVALITIPICIGAIVIKSFGLAQLTEDSIEQSTGILISSQYDTDNDHYDVKIWDADHNEVNLVYPKTELTFKPGDDIEFTSYINYRNGDHHTDTRTLRQMNYADKN